jgi:diguanylate cyclase (GGDEF)-like protein/putative nucleotidyltransferase with HDIG domain
MWELTRRAKLFLSIAYVSGLSILLWQLSDLPWQNPWTLVLAGLAALAQTLKVEGATARSSYNLSWLLYGFAFVLLGTPAALLVILAAHLVDWVWHKYPWYIQAFNIAAYTLATFCAHLVLHWIAPNLGIGELNSTLGLLAGLLTFTTSNHLMVGTAIWMVRGENFARSGVFQPLTLLIDFTLLSLGAISALVWTIHPSVVLLTLTPLFLIYSTLKLPALNRQTQIDPKTGLYNVRFFAEALKTELARADRFDTPLTVVMGDLDLLRNINNTYGHLAGDAVLIGVATILQQHFRDYDVVARFGGEEFAILLPETTLAQAWPRVEAARQAIEQAGFEVSTHPIPLQATLSFGLADRSDFGQLPEELIHQSDLALYRAKLRGRNRTCSYSEVNLEGECTPLRPAEPMPTQTAKPDRLAANLPAYQPISLRRGYPQEKGLPQTRTEPASATAPQPAWQTQVYIGTLFLLGLGLLGLILPSERGADWLGVGVFALVIFLTEWFAVDIYIRDNSISTSTAPLIAGVLLFGPPGAVCLSLVLATTALIKHRSPLHRYIFNISNHVIATSLSAGLLLLLRLPFTSQPPLVQMLSAVVVGELMFISSTFLLASVMGLATGQPVLQIWQGQFRWLTPYYLAFGLGGYALTLGYSYAGVIGVVAIVVSLLILRISQVQYLEQTQTLVTKLRAKTVELENYAGEISNLNEGLLLSLSNLLDLRDTYTFGHSEQVASYAVLVAEQLGLTGPQIELLRKASLLHDIGKVGIEDAILYKPGPLTGEEYARIKQHPVVGAEILAANEPLRPLVPIVRHHHERYDGQGYPDGLRGQEIPLEARILGLADALEAMASDRPYRQALGFQQIIQEVTEHAGTQFDPEVAAAFLAIAHRRGPTLLVNSAYQTTPTTAFPLRNSPEKAVLP